VRKTHKGLYTINENVTATRETKVTMSVQQLENLIRKVVRVD